MIVVFTKSICKRRVRLSLEFDLFLRKSGHSKRRHRAFTIADEFDHFLLQILQDTGCRPLKGKTKRLKCSRSVRASLPLVVLFQQLAKSFDIQFSKEFEFLRGR